MSLPPEACGPPSWRWLNPLPQGFGLNAVWGAAEAEQWLVGDGGTILRWQGSSVTQIKSPTTANLYGVWGSGPRDIWIAGDRGTLLHSDGGCFTQVASGTTAPLRSVFSVARDDVWAVGEQGTILHYDGKRWFPIDSMGSGRLVSVWASGPRDIWIADQSPSSVLHFDGIRLTRFPMAAKINAVSGSGPSDVWFVGISSPATAQAWRFDGSNYRQIMPPGYGSALTAVSSRGASDVLVAGENGILLKYDGAAWTPVPGSRWDTGAQYRALWRGSGASARVLGAKGFIGRVDGSGLTRVSQDLAEGSKLQGMWASGPDDLWAVGDDGVILHWDGSSVVKHPSGVRDDLLAVWGSAPDDVWAVGGISSGSSTSRVLHWNGSSWSQVPHIPAAQLTTIWGSSARDVWIGGDRGTLIHWDGTSLSPVATGTMFKYLALSGTKSDELWSLRYDGPIHRYDGIRWTQISTPMARFAITTFWSGGPSDLWVGGQGGFLTHFDGTNWVQEPDLGGSVASIWGSGRADVWAVLTYSTSELPKEALIHYDGTSWSKAAVGMAWFPGAVHGAGSGRWVSGANGSLIQVQR